VEPPPPREKENFKTFAYMACIYMMYQSEGLADKTIIMEVIESIDRTLFYQIQKRTEKQNNE
jgi:hypothetical protein